MAFASSVLPTPASPSSNRGRCSVSARNTDVAKPSSGRYPLALSAAETSTGVMSASEQPESSGACGARPSALQSCLDDRVDLAVLVRDLLVGIDVGEPGAALGEVLEGVGTASGNDDRDAAGSVRPLLQRVCMGVPGVEVTEHRHRVRRVGEG